MEFAVLPCSTGSVGWGVRTSRSGCLRMRIIVMTPAITEPTGGVSIIHTIGCRYQGLQVGEFIGAGTPL
jgi:hypothetical protein